MSGEKVKHRKAVRDRLEAEAIARATPAECEQAATLARSQSEIAKSNTSKIAFDLLAALASREAESTRLRVPDPGESSP